MLRSVAIAKTAAKMAMARVGMSVRDSTLSVREGGRVIWGRFQLRRYRYERFFR